LFEFCFLISCRQFIKLAKFCLLPEFESIPNFSVFFSIYQCHASDVSIKRKKGNVQETMRSEKLPTAGIGNSNYSLAHGPKSPKEKKIERNNS